MSVSAEDIAVAMGRTPTTAEIARWAMCVADARLLIRIGDGDRAGLGDLALLDQEVLDYVVREAVVAYLRRPDDATQVDVTVDATSVSKRYTTGKGRVTILDEWWKMLAPSRTTGDAFSIPLNNDGGGVGPDVQFEYPNPNHAAYPGLSYPWPLQP